MYENNHQSRNEFKGVILPYGMFGVQYLPQSQF